MAALRVRIRCKDGTRTVRAIEIAGGLALHKSTARAVMDVWTITHARSGYAAVIDIHGRAKAIEIMGRLLAAADWDRDYRQVLDSPACREVAMQEQRAQEGR